MTSSPIRSSISSPTSVPSRSLLSRLKSPLHSKTRNFTDFYIQADDPHRQYSPGDIITGSVIIKVVKPLRITHLVVSLHGYAQVFKNPNSPGDGYKQFMGTAGSKGKKSGSYYGNGFASLFEEEVVLCGEGRLGEGVYHFNFELEFPSKGLPSSIDFERGTVSYMLTSTLTRPTTIAPTTICDTKVYLVENLDIAPIPGPKPRVVTLEPVSRRARTRTRNATKKRPQTAEMIQPTADGSEPSRSGRISELSGVAEESDTPGSPAPSEISFDSQFSSGNGSATEYGVRTANSDSGTLNSSTMHATAKTITTTIELPKGGFLRGDPIPIKISVNHTKHVKSLHGIIITLHRQARVDMHPALPVAIDSKGDKQKSEEYYPKSRTGLGGLSLSGTGSSHLFRKDLSQSFAPLFVDPRTLTAEVKATVRVPEEAFPTIQNVPGAMISFKYFVEVAVDIQGKLSGLDRMFPSSGLVSVPSSYGDTPGFGRAEDATGSIFSTWGGNFLDTDAIRREKGVVSCSFEVVIGTRDSDRKGKKKQGPSQAQDLESSAQPGVHEIPLGPNEADQYPSGAAQGWYDQQDSSYGYDRAYHDGQYATADYPAEYYESPAYQDIGPPHTVPPPSQSEHELSEKEQLQRAEARLLPSQPPDASNSDSTYRPHGIPPSAPRLPEEDDPPYLPRSSTSNHQHRSIDEITTAIPTAFDNASPAESSSTPSTITVVRAESRHKRLPAIPHSPSSPAPHYMPSLSHVPPMDDKYELQRRRLEMERSAPPEDLPEEAQMRNSASSAQHMTLAPSAPVLDDEDEALVGPATHAESSTDRHGSVLPPYER